MPHLTLYSKPGCHLCADLLAALQPLMSEFDITISEVDISGDPDLLRRYRFAIPVLEIAGGPTFKAPIALEQVIEGLASVQ